jgi:hypothetical protein
VGKVLVNAVFPRQPQNALNVEVLRLRTMGDHGGATGTMGETMGEVALPVVPEVLRRARSAVRTCPHCRWVRFLTPLRNHYSPRGSNAISRVSECG